MSNKRFRILTRRLLPLLALAAASACQSAPEAPSPDSQLVNKANESYADERFTQAAERYRQINDEHPDSPYLRLALLGLADSLYKDTEYVEASLYYERFIQLYPLDPLTPRALFYQGMSAYLDTSTSDRDQTNTLKSIELFNSFLAAYPAHPLAPLARERKGNMESQFAESHLEVARFYYRINQNNAALIRLREFMQAYPASPLMPEALFLMGDCYYREQAYKEAGRAFISLMENYPSSEYAPQAARLAETLKLESKAP
ncbi:MAG: outer membrane protein assembly factor BamD [Nitrospinae bacterium]|nr:outer membrane protein assembly factor BamD [Nitrospinota bacterium]